MIKIALSSIVAVAIFACDKIIVKKQYTSCYSTYYKSSTKLSYFLDQDLLKIQDLKGRFSFYKDSAISEDFQISPHSFAYSGYDRGHLRSDASSDFEVETLKASYSMINIVAQTPKLNRVVMAKNERLERALTEQYKKVFVEIDILFDKEVQLVKNSIPVAAYFYKKIYNEEFKRCFLFPNIFDINTSKDFEINCIN